MILLKHFVINNYVRRIDLTKGRRAKLYSKTDKVIPQRFLLLKGNRIKLKSPYIWKFKGIKEVIYNPSNKTYPCRNEASLTKPRTMVIAGNTLHSLTMLKSHRAKVMRAIKEQFKEILTKGSPKSFPIAMKFIFLCPRYANSKEAPDGSISGMEDLDNHKLFYEKAIIDACKMFEEDGDGGHKRNHKGFLPEDTVDYVSDIQSAWYEHAGFKLIVEIYKFEDGERENSYKYYANL